MRKRINKTIISVSGNKILSLNICHQIAFLKPLLKELIDERFQNETRCNRR